MSLDNTVPFGFARCGACQYWSGQKSVNSLGRLVSYDMYEKARCNCFEANRPTEVSGDDCCNYYKAID